MTSKQGEGRSKSCWVSPPSTVPEMCPGTSPSQHITHLQNSSLLLQSPTQINASQMGWEWDTGCTPEPKRAPEVLPIAQWDPAQPDGCSALSLAFPESTNVAFTITMLLASLSSCCNPWIYMFFSGHLLQDAARCLSCWGGPRPGLRRQASTGSLCSRKTTILSHSHHTGPAGLPLHGGFCPPCEEVVTESGTL